MFTGSSEMTKKNAPSSKAMQEMLSDNKESSRPSSSQGQEVS